MRKRSHALAAVTLAVVLRTSASSTPCAFNSIYFAHMKVLVLKIRRALLSESIAGRLTNDLETWCLKALC